MFGGSWSGHPALWLSTMAFPCFLESACANTHPSPSMMIPCTTAPLPRDRITWPLLSKNVKISWGNPSWYSTMSGSSLWWIRKFSIAMGNDCSRVKARKIVCAVLVRISEPPEAPITIDKRGPLPPSVIAMVGVVEEAGRLPGLRGRQTTTREVRSCKVTHLIVQYNSSVSHYFGAKEKVNSGGHRNGITIWGKYSQVRCSHIIRGGVTRIIVREILSLFIWNPPPDLGHVSCIKQPALALQDFLTDRHTAGVIAKRISQPRAFGKSKLEALHKAVVKSVCWV